MAEFTYRCSTCKTAYRRDSVRYLCPACGGQYRPGEPLRGVLEVEFDYERARRELQKKPADFAALCAVEEEYHPNFPVGRTPYLEAPRLAQETGWSRLWLKNDGLNPSGSLKDRASFLVVAEAIRLGERKIVTASTGNAAAALAAVCAAADRKAVIFVPRTAPRAKLVQMLLHGAAVVPVLGSYDDAFRLSLEYTQQRGGLNRNTAYHPLTIEGKKTVALEIFLQHGRRAPEAVIVPAGDGVIIAGVFKGFLDLMRTGLIERLPKLIGVQAETSDAIHHLVTTGQYRNARSPATIADSISVCAPSNAFLAKRAIEESGGFTVTVSDDEILAGQSLLARAAGIFAEPAAAATVAALPKIKNRLARDAEIVLLVTGHGLKDIDTPLKGLVIPEAVEAKLDCVPEDL